MRALGLILLLVNCTACPATGDFSAWFDPVHGDGTRPAGSADSRDVQLMPPVGRLTVRDVPSITPLSFPRAFPGAEGFGAEATGGRGGRVIYVTNLNARGPGSLQEALEAEGPRYVLFKVSGLINASVQVKHGDLTIAGHTSPGGIIVRGFHTDETTHFCATDCDENVRGIDNVIVRHIRSRPRPTSQDGLVDGDGFRLRFSRNTILDHVSSGNAVDEAFEISFSNNITVQDSVLSETLGEHTAFGGMLVNYSNPASGHGLDNLAILRNVWVRLQGRYPELSRESPAAVNSTLHIELSNNMLWDQRFYVSSGHYGGNQGERRGPAFYQLNWVGNFSTMRDTYGYGMLWFENPSGMSSVYFYDDHCTRYPDRTDWALNYCCDDYPRSPAVARPTWARDDRHPFERCDVTYLPADQVRRYALAHVGAFPRDPMDRRLMGMIADGRATGVPTNVNPANDTWSTDFPANAPPAAPQDTDNDGMPDAWEMANNLDPRVDDHNDTAVGMARPEAWLHGYPNLEVYLHDLAERRLTEGPWATQR